jgi:hypothetical protein
MDTATTDLFCSVAILGVISAVATNAIALPAFLTTTASGAIVLVGGLLASTVLPLVGVSLLVFAIILFFRRNMNHTIQGTLRQFEAERAYPPTPAVYGENTIPLDRQGPQTPGYESTRSGPREYTPNLGTLDVQQAPSPPQQGVDRPAENGIQTVLASMGMALTNTGMRGIEGFAPATLEQSAELDPPKGQFRTDESRQTADPVTDTYTYRPAADTGTNEFQRFGPQMDKKVDSFRYYA